MLTLKHSFSPGSIIDMHTCCEIVVCLVWFSVPIRHEFILKTQVQAKNDNSIKGFL